MLGCDRIAREERFFSTDPAYEFTGFTIEHTSSLELYADHFHESLPCRCLPSLDYFAPLPDGTHWHPPKAFDTARHALVQEVDGQWEPVAWCRREYQAEELLRQRLGARIAPVHRDFPHPARCR
ncbi:hypothetical protein KDL01_10090 [Actinospica durhamensis]|uniref:Uncharacterized protein n=1 Tax=Actinospica durhamensis TaxID=1508375 RepID=A0A941EM20_9ACTN|nr:hypothetical protein [Actinospica durhamensis]MBR7833616.1 hypothetical protein [Actinospica durhamensis]